MSKILTYIYLYELLFFHGYSFFFPFSFFLFPFLFFFFFFLKNRIHTCETKHFDHDAKYQNDKMHDTMTHMYDEKIANDMKVQAEEIAQEQTVAMNELDGFLKIKEAEIEKKKLQGEAATVLIIEKTKIREMKAATLEFKKNEMRMLDDDLAIVEQEILGMYNIFSWCIFLCTKYY